MWLLGLPKRRAIDDGKRTVPAKQEKTNFSSLRQMTLRDMTNAGVNSGDNRMARNTVIMTAWGGCVLPGQEMQPPGQQRCYAPLSSSLGVLRGRDEGPRCGVNQAQQFPASAD